MLLSELNWMEYPGLRYGWIATIGEGSLKRDQVVVWSDKARERFTIREPGYIGRYHREVEPIVAQAILFHLSALINAPRK